MPPHPSLGSFQPPPTSFPSCPPPPPSRLPPPSPSLPSPRPRRCCRYPAPAGTRRVPAPLQARALSLRRCCDGRAGAGAAAAGPPISDAGAAHDGSRRHCWYGPPTGGGPDPAPLLACRHPTTEKVRRALLSIDSGDCILNVRISLPIELSFGHPNLLHRQPQKVRLILAFAAVLFMSQ